MSQELDNFIKQARAEGYPDLEIANSLREAGWTEELVAQALAKKYVQKKKHRILTVSLWTLGILGAFSGFVYYLPNFIDTFIPDAKPLSTASFALAQVPREVRNDNAFLQLVELNQLVFLTQEEKNLLVDYVVRGVEVEESQLQVILEKNEQALEVYEEMFTKTYFQDPQYYDPVVMTDEFISLIPLRYAGYLALAHARRVGGEEGMLIARESLELAGAIINGRGHYATMLYGVSLYRNSLITISTLYQEEVYEEEMINSVVELLDTNALNVSHLRSSIVMDFHLTNLYLDTIASKDEDKMNMVFSSVVYPVGAFSRTLLVHEQRTKNLYIAELQRMVDAMDSICVFAEYKPTQLPTGTLFGSIAYNQGQRNDAFNTWARVQVTQAEKYCEAQQLHSQVRASFE